MNNDIIKAKEILTLGEYTCVICRENKVYTSNECGIKPLIDFIESGIDFKGFSAADKIVGKAAAMLYVNLGVAEVYADVMSESAIKVLSQHGIEFHSCKIIKEIRNRQNTGCCPMENAVRDIQNPQKAYETIKQTIQSLRGKTV